MLKEDTLAAFMNTGERKAAKFLKEHPELVVWGFCTTGGHSKYVLYEFPFGANYKADFVIPFSYSGAWDVHLVELEPVDDQVVTKNGNPSYRLNSAFSQLNDWQEYIERNQTQFRMDLSKWCDEKDQLCWHNNDHPPCNYTNNYLRDPNTVIFYYYHVIIGRRKMINEETRRRMNQFRKRNDIQIRTYDCFVDIAGNYDLYRQNPHKSVYLPSTNEEAL